MLIEAVNLSKPIALLRAAEINLLLETLDVVDIGDDEFVAFDPFILVGACGDDAIVEEQCFELSDESFAFRYVRQFYAVAAVALIGLVTDGPVAFEQAAKETSDAAS
jgi:hypothetical protein